MPNLEDLYAEFEEIAVERLPVDVPPTAVDVERAAAALGLPVPKDFVDFLCQFPNQVPPFWDVFRIRPAGAAEVNEDLVRENVTYRRSHPGELTQCLLFKAIGDGGYFCFVFSKSGKLLGIGCWERDNPDRDVPPKILYTDWADWFAEQMDSLREE